MRFAEFFDGATRPVVSFEVFPPKSEKAEAQLRDVLPRLIALAPDYMTVTYGAFGSTQEKTLDIAAGIKSDFGIETASHLTCVGSTREEIDGILDRLRQGGIENIVALRGDPPQGEEKFVAVEGGYQHASQLVTHIHERGDFGVAVAGYPEKHIEAPDFDSDLRFLKAKVDCGADIVITQLFYDNSDYFNFVDKAQALGIDVPIVAGLLPIQSFGQIQRIAQLCGARIPAPLEQQLIAAGDDAARVRQIGVEWASIQVRDLIDRGVPGIHFYVLNRALHMERIFDAVGVKR